MKKTDAATMAPPHERATVTPAHVSDVKVPSSFLCMLQEKLPWVAVFVFGLLVGWLVLGGILILPPSLTARPEHLGLHDKTLYLRTLADSYYWTSDRALVQEALEGWEPSDLAAALAQAEAEALDEGSRHRLGALRSLLGIPTGPVTFWAFVRNQGPIYATLLLSALLFIVAGGVMMFPQIQSAVTTLREDGANAAEEDAVSTEGGSVFVVHEGESLADVMSSFSEASDRDQSAVDRSVAEKVSEAVASAARQTEDGPMSAIQEAAPEESGAADPAAATATEEEKATTQTSAPSDRPVQGSAGDAQPSSDGPSAAQSSTATPATPTTPRGPGATSDSPDGSGPDVAPAPEGLVAGMLSDDANGNDLRALLADQVFDQIFDIEDLFDPMLRDLSESVDDISIEELLRKCQLTNMQLQARYYVPQPVEEDVDE